MYCIFIQRVTIRTCHIRNKGTMQTVYEEEWIVLIESGMGFVFHTTTLNTDRSIVEPGQVSFIRRSAVIDLQHSRIPISCDNCWCWEWFLFRLYSDSAFLAYHRVPSILGSWSDGVSQYLNLQSYRLSFKTSFRRSLALLLKGKGFDWREATGNGGGFNNIP